MRDGKREGFKRQRVPSNTDTHPMNEHKKRQQIVHRAEHANYMCKSKPSITNQSTAKKVPSANVKRARNQLISTAGGKQIRQRIEHRKWNEPENREKGESCES